MRMCLSVCVSLFFCLCVCVCVQHVFGCSFPRSHIWPGSYLNARQANERNERRPRARSLPHPHPHTYSNNKQMYTKRVREREPQRQQKRCLCCGFVRAALGSTSGLGFGSALHGMARLGSARLDRVFYVCVVVAGLSDFDFVHCALLCASFEELNRTLCRTPPPLLNVNVLLMLSALSLSRPLSIECNGSALLRRRRCRCCSPTAYFNGFSCLVGFCFVLVLIEGPKTHTHLHIYTLNSLPQPSYCYCCCCCR